jgi:hypothetical protein
MSYILDALKKAERDRRGARVPSLGTMHAVPRERRPVWPWIVGGALAVNLLGVAALLLLRPAPEPVPATAPATVSSLPTVPVSAGPAPTPEAASAATATIAATDPVGPVTPPAPAVRSTERPARPATKPDNAPTRETVRPAVARTTARERDAGAEPAPLKLEILIYSEHSRERAVYINGQRYVEGQRVAGAIVVERIQPDGVVLAGGGQRYLLRQE